MTACEGVSSGFNTWIHTMSIIAADIRQSLFVERYLPVIESSAAFRFRFLSAEACAEAKQDVTAAAWISFSRASEAGVAWDGQAGDRTGMATPSRMAKFAIADYYLGREALGTCTTDPLSPATRKAGRARVVPFTLPDGHNETPVQLIADSKSDPAVRTRLKLDWTEISRRCTPQAQRTLDLLVRGWRPLEIAKRLRVSPARITALKRQIGTVASSLGYGPKPQPYRRRGDEDGEPVGAIPVP